MAFKGMEQLEQDTPMAVSGSGWVKLVDDQPVTVTVIEYVGVTHSKKYPDKEQYRFLVESAGTRKNLDANWRLMKALKDMAKTQAAAFTVEITQKKVITEITDQATGTKKKQLVNDYTLTLLTGTAREPGDDDGEPI